MRTLEWKSTKKWMMILLLSVLLTSCYSYKKVDLQQAEFKQGDKYRIHLIEKSTQKGKFYSINDSLIILHGRRGQIQEISLKEIRMIKKRKFSWGKTIALPLGILIGAAGMSMAIDGGPRSIDIGGH